MSYLFPIKHSRVPLWPVRLNGKKFEHPPSSRAAAAAGLNEKTRDQQQQRMIESLKNFSNKKKVNARRSQ